MELGPNQKKWVAALRSGEYKQAKDFMEHKGGFCCLGVSAKVLDPYIILEGKHDLGPFPEVFDAYGFRCDLGEIDGDHSWGDKVTCLAEANDRGVTFAEIADFIEAHPDAVFTESK